MSTRIVPLILLLLLLLVLTQLVSGRGSVEHVATMRHQIAEQKAANDKARKENERLNAEVSDLKYKSAVGVNPNRRFCQLL